MLTVPAAPRPGRAGALSVLTITSGALTVAAVLLWALAYTGPLGNLIMIVLIPVHLFLAVKLVGDVALSALAAQRRSPRAAWANATVTVVDAGLVAWGHAYGFADLFFLMTARI